MTLHPGFESQVMLANNKNSIICEYQLRNSILRDISPTVCYTLFFFFKRGALLEGISTIWLNSLWKFEPGNMPSTVSQQVCEQLFFSFVFEEFRINGSFNRLEVELEILMLELICCDCMFVPHQHRSLHCFRQPSEYVVEGRTSPTRFQPKYLPRIHTTPSRMKTSLFVRQESISFFFKTTVFLIVKLTELW